MILEIIANVILIIGVCLGEALASLAFRKSQSFKELAIELVLFIVIINLFLNSILVVDNVFIQMFLYFLLGFVSIISARTVIFFLFRNESKALPYKVNPVNKSLIRLALELNKKVGRDELVSLFRRAGFSSSFTAHLDSIIKEEHSGSGPVPKHSSHKK